MEPKWLKWAKSLQAISQVGLTFTSNEFDIERYKKIRKIAAEMMSANSDTDFEFIHNLFNYEDGYPTPKVDVRGVVFQDDKILLVKEKVDGGWTLPGGWAEPNETPSQSVEREVLEESGYVVSAEKVSAIYDRTKQGHTPPHPYHVYKIFFLCKILGGESVPSLETDDVGFFDKDNLPNLSDARIKKHQILRLFEHYKNPSLSVDFD
ncbi:MAG TPA: NUDIX domain-containing protein [Ignavibacteria bacterium]|nr:NUDIX domain-containing protein [Ignavibacteria bacterium]